MSDHVIKLSIMPSWVSYSVSFLFLVSSPFSDIVPRSRGEILKLVTRPEENKGWNKICTFFIVWAHLGDFFGTSFDTFFLFGHTWGIPFKLFLATFFLFGHTWWTPLKLFLITFFFLGTLRDFFETFLDICFCLEFFLGLLVVSFTACFKVFFRAFGGYFESFF